MPTAAAHRNNAQKIHLLYISGDTRIDKNTMPAIRHIWIVASNHPNRGVCIPLTHITRAGTTEQERNTDLIWAYLLA